MLSLQDQESPQMSPDTSPFPRRARGGLVQKLDSGLDSWTGLWTEIWTGFLTEDALNDDHFQLFSLYLGEESCDQDCQWTQSITVT